MRPPPTDPIFTILVSLLTVLISIPVTMILTVVLEEYCSKYAGGRLHEADFMVKKDENIATSVSEGTQMMKNVNEYGFGDVIRNGIWNGSPSNVNGISDTSKTAYNGMSTFNLNHQNSFMNFKNYKLTFLNHPNYRFLISCGRGNDDSGPSPFFSLRW